MSSDVQASIPAARPTDKSLIAFMALTPLTAARVMPTRLATYTNRSGMSPGRRRSPRRDTARTETIVPDVHQADFKPGRRDSPNNTNADLPFGSSAILGSFVASGAAAAASRRRRGPVTLRPRLSPGVLWSRCMGDGTAWYRSGQ